MKNRALNVLKSTRQVLLLTSLLKRGWLKSAVIAGSMACSNFASGLVFADDTLKLVDPNQRVKPGIVNELMSRTQAGKIATLRADGGRVLDVQPLQPDQAGYRVKLFKEGKVQTLIVRDRD